MREDQRRRKKIRRQKMQVREQVAKSRNTVFFQWFSKSRLAKAAGAEPSGQMRDEQLHAVVVRSTCRSQNVQSTSFGALLEVEMSKKCTLLWRGAHFEANMLRAPHACTILDHFWTFRCRFACQAQGIQHLPKKGAKREGFVAVSKTLAGVGHLKRICQDAFRVACAIQETCSSEMLGGQGADFLRGLAFWSIRSSGLLRWSCVTGAAFRMTWPHFFRGKRSTLDRWSGKIAKGIATRPSALHSSFHFWRKSRRNCFVFGAVNLENWGSLAALLRFLTLSSSKIEEVLQNCCVFDVVKFKNWGSLAA